MISLRRRLLLYIFIILAIGTTSVAMATYAGLKHELNELYDANMKQLGMSVSASLPTPDKKLAAYPSYNEWPHGEEVFLIQIWKDGTLEYSSHSVVNFPLQTDKTAGNTVFNNENWSFYNFLSMGRVVQISQSLEQRNDVVNEIYKAVLIPVLIQLPLLLIIIWVFVGYGFRPFTRISNMIKSRTADFMQPISIDDTPLEIHTLVMALNDLLKRLDHALQAQKQFTADAAHELRTPLTAVRLQLDLLQRSKTDEERLEAIQTLERGVSRSMHLVHQLLELARQEPDTDIDQITFVNLAALTQTITLEQKSLADAKAIDLQTQLENLTVQGNATSLSIMIGNLLNNAITYTNSGGHIHLHTYLEGNMPVLEVSDDGIGIKPEDRQRIFDRFYRVTGTGAPGSGLGLSIVKTIAEKHGIKIHISEGISGKGTTFRLIFPAP